MDISKLSFLYFASRASCAPKHHTRQEVWNSSTFPYIMKSENCMPNLLCIWVGMLGVNFPLRRNGIGTHNSWLDPCGGCIWSLWSPKPLFSLPFWIFYARFCWSFKLKELVRAGNTLPAEKCVLETTLYVRLKLLDDSLTEGKPPAVTRPTCGFWKVSLLYYRAQEQSFGGRQHKLQLSSAKFV